jgi:LuxR family maltose regulon positive regulatory protein
VNETIQQARRALELAPEDDFLRRGGAATLQGLALWTIGDLETARQMYLDGIVSLQRAGYMADSLGVSLALADIVIAQGHLHQAMSIYEQALRFAYEHGEPNLRGTADMLVGMGEVHLERNDLEMAAQCLQRSQEQGEHTGLPQHRYRWRVAMGRLVEAEGDFIGALALLDEAERLYASDFFPNVRPISALKVRVWVEQNKLVEALDWAHERKLSVEDDLSYLNEFEHITLARILLARYKSDRADHYLLETMGLLERLLKAAEEGGRTGSAIEILVLQALANHAQGDLPAALLPLQHALTLAEPEGYVRMFVDEGPPMAQLLSKAAASG